MQRAEGENFLMKAPSIPSSTSTIPICFRNHRACIWGPSKWRGTVSSMASQIHHHSPIFPYSLMPRTTHLGIIAWWPGRGNYVVHKLDMLQQCSSCFSTPPRRTLLGRAVVEISYLHDVHKQAQTPHQQTWGNLAMLPLEKGASCCQRPWLQVYISPPSLPFCITGLRISTNPI